MAERTFGRIDRSPNAVWPPYERYVPANRAQREVMIRDALRGVELGAYDERIVTWLSDWDIPTVAVIVSLLERARAAGCGEGLAEVHGGESSG
ncbi:hypothetical protein LWC34_39005 [Kibdelosporangium philippinense]|uniref:Uncharacterized protein n=1 Tax=Kibdelosporangium philippinense TaxID=211113 RepID=A0ABS8ZLT6_9PSEU|nr:hypothetical protein [Kibdelosporangium philippinense]MCE7008760.1 hypothetical protein [Kibdelosporangium philippinense]